MRRILKKRMGSNFFDIKFLNTKSLTPTNLKICQQKLKIFFEDQPKIAIFQETNQLNSGVQTLLKIFRFELGGYKVLLHHNPINQQRSMLIFIHRTCPLTPSLGLRKLITTASNSRWSMKTPPLHSFAPMPPVMVRTLSSYTKSGGPSWTVKRPTVPY